MAGAASLCRSQTSSELNTYFHQNVGLTQDQVAATTRRVGFKLSIALQKAIEIPQKVFRAFAPTPHAEVEHHRPMRLPVLP
jgi:hypothetical protein